MVKPQRVFNRTALITGASAGLGAEFARQLAADGYDLVLVARRLEKLEAVAEQIRQQRSDCVIHCIQADLGDVAAPAEIQAQCQALGVQVDYLVNNAGAAGPDLLDGTPWPKQAAYTQLMMVSVAEMVHRFVPAMLEQGFGRVINVSSVAGRIIQQNSTSYGPTKAYLIALSESMAALRKQGVNVSALCPGFTHTEFHDQSNALKDMKAGTPSWVWYSAEEVVAEGIRAVEKGHPIYVSGRLYRWLDPILQMPWVRALVRRA